MKTVLSIFLLTTCLASYAREQGGSGMAKDSPQTVAVENMDAFSEEDAMKSLFELIRKSGGNTFNDADAPFAPYTQKLSLPPMVDIGSMYPGIPGGLSASRLYRPELTEAEQRYELYERTRTVQRSIAPQATGNTETSTRYYIGTGMSGDGYLYRRPHGFRQVGVSTFKTNLGKGVTLKVERYDIR